MKESKQQIIQLVKYCDLVTQPYIDEDQAIYLSKSCRSLLQRARKNRELSYFKKGDITLYKPKDVLDWLERQLVSFPAIIAPKNRRRTASL